MSAAEIAGYTAQAMDSTSPAASLVATCQDTIDNPIDYTNRGGDDGNAWPGSALACAFAYKITQRMDYLQQAVMYLQASLSDDQDLGDGLACVPGVSTSWQSWAMNPNCTPPPPILQTITHDTGYPMRWYGPDVALAYDWLNGAPGQVAALLSQTVTCLDGLARTTTSQYGYHHDEAGAELQCRVRHRCSPGRSGHRNRRGRGRSPLGARRRRCVRAAARLRTGLAGSGTLVGMPAGAMVGGDWLGGLAIRAAEREGVRGGGAHAGGFGRSRRWMRGPTAPRFAIYGTLPTMDGMWPGGDFESTQVYESPNVGVLDAVSAGPSSDQAAAWAISMAQQQNLTGSADFYGAMAALRQVTPVDYTTQTPAPPLWQYLLRSRAFARTSDQSAFWGVFSSLPKIVSDHEHDAAAQLRVQPRRRLS